MLEIAKTNPTISNVPTITRIVMMIARGKLRFNIKSFIKISFKIPILAKQPFRSIWVFLFSCNTFTVIKSPGFSQLKLIKNSPSFSIICVLELKLELVVFIDKNRFYVATGNTQRSYFCGKIVPF